MLFEKLKSFKKSVDAEAVMKLDDYTLNESSVPALSASPSSLSKG